MNIELYHTTEELKRMFRKEKDQRLAVRILAIYLGLMGKTTVETAEFLGYSRRVVQAWVNSYNRQGYSADSRAVILCSL